MNTDPGAMNRNKRPDRAVFRDVEGKLRIHCACGTLLYIGRKNPTFKTIGCPDMKCGTITDIQLNENESNTRQESASVAQA